MTTADEELVKRAGAWFEDEGVPHFIEDPSDDGDRCRACS